MKVLVAARFDGFGVVDAADVVVVVEFARQGDLPVASVGRTVGRGSEGRREVDGSGG